jgi:hypothetical protein
VVAAKPPDKMASNKIQCDACPVLCQISDGRLGACDRWGNVGGRLTRTDPLVLMRRPDIEVVAVQAGEGGADQRAAAVEQGHERCGGRRRRLHLDSDGRLRDRRPLRFRRCQRHHYPDYKPAPFIVASEHRGVDLVTVVTEGIFSYCSFKVKIDTDRYLGPEQATVRHKGERSGM